jgi:uncharacterized protein (TIGR00730 family)
VRIAVFCGSSRRAPAHCLDAARVVGAEIARRGHLLIYGGGRTGLMGALADAALEARGVVHGVILREFIEQDVHHQGLAELYAVDDMRARKAGLDERADAFVALPGGLGTLEEVTEILSFRKLGLHHRPLVLLNLRGFFDGLVAQIERGIAEDLDAGSVRAYLLATDDPAAVVGLCEGRPEGAPASPRPDRGPRRRGAQAS